MKLIISALVTLTFAFSIYRAWNGVEVPGDISAKDVWKVKTIEFVLKLTNKLVGWLKYLEMDHLIRPTLSAAYSLLQDGIWPFTNSFATVKVERIQMAGVPVVHYKYNHQEFDPQGHPVIIYFHGGGWQVFDEDFARSTLRLLADKLRISVYSVDYRLAPEHPYPAGLNDCLSVTNYVLDHFKQLNIHPDKVIVAGDSAGGNLAAAVSLKLKKKLRLQVLIYPLMQAFDFQTPSYRENEGKLGSISNTDLLKSCVVNYLGLSGEAHALLIDNKHISKATRNKYSRYVHSQLISHLNITKMNSIDESNIKYSTNIKLVEEIERLVVDPYFSPLMSNSLDNLTHAYIITAQHDVLRDDGLLYHSRLEKAKGVNSTLVNYQQGFHSFFTYASGPLKLESAVHAVDELVEYMQSHIFN